MLCLKFHIQFIFRAASLDCSSFFFSNFTSRVCFRIVLAELECWPKANLYHSQPLYKRGSSREGTGGSCSNYIDSSKHFQHKILCPQQPCVLIMDNWTPMNKIRTYLTLLEQSRLVFQRPRASEILNLKSSEILNLRFEVMISTVYSCCGKGTIQSYSGSINKHV
uniref:Uncharacterized protein n=1 Tax=Cacopsylla melanoneura TaxID=428564 RepID=A0A8D8ZAD5_9HEMI